MNYSDLNIEDKKIMLDLSEELNSITMLRETLLDKLSPLKDELSDLKKEISSLNDQAKDLYGIIQSDERTVETTSQYSETLKQIDGLESKYVEVESSILKLKNEINPLLAEENEIILEMNNLKIKNNDKYELNEDGVIIVKDIDNLNFKEEQKINIDNNIIINTKKNVCNFIKDKFEKSKNTIIHPVVSLKEKINNFYNNKIKPTLDEIKEEYIAGYNSVRNETKEDAIDEIISQRKKVKEEAENLEFVKKDENKKDDNKKDNVIPEEFRLEDQESKKEGFEFVEEQEPLKLEDQEAKKEGFEFVEEQEPLKLEDQEAKKEGFEFVNEPVTESPIVQNEEILNNAKYVESKVVEDNNINNIFMSTPINDNSSSEVEQTITSESEVISFDKTDHFINSSNNKIAKTTKLKIDTMIVVFSSLPKYVGWVMGDVQNNLDNIEEKKRLLQNKKMLHTQQLEQMQASNNQYTNGVENIFATQNSMRF